MIGISDLKASKSFCSEGYDRKVFSVVFLLSVGPLWRYICTYFYCSLYCTVLYCTVMEVYLYIFLLFTHQERNFMSWSGPGRAPVDSSK